MDRNLDGIYVRIKRGEKYEAVCLSDMTREELEGFLADKDNIEWTNGALVHLALTLKEIGDRFDIVVI